MAKKINYANSRKLLKKYWENIEQDFLDNAYKLDGAYEHLETCSYSVVFDSDLSRKEIHQAAMIQIKQIDKKLKALQDDIANLHSVKNKLNFAAKQILKKK